MNTDPYSIPLSPNISFIDERFWLLPLFPYSPIEFVGKLIEDGDSLFNSTNLSSEMVFFSFKVVGFEKREIL